MAVYGCLLGYDRIAKEMIEEAERTGKLKPGSTIIEPTSGNTGIGLAAIAAAKGYRIIIVLPETMSVERRNIIKAYGAELVLSDGTKGMKGAIQKAQEIAAENAHSFIPSQFTNNANPKAHYDTTGPEIWNDTDGAVDIFVAGVGTGGTLTGVGEYLKSKNPNVKIIAVEPEASPVLSKGESGAHKIQGIGANFIPDNYDASLADDVMTVTDDDAINTARLLARKEYLPHRLCGDLRLPAERSRLRKTPGLPCPGRLRHRAGGRRCRCSHHEHLRHPGTRRAACLRQPGRPDPHQAPPSPAEDLPLRLHGR